MGHLQIATTIRSWSVLSGRNDFMSGQYASQVSCRNVSSITSRVDNLAPFACCIGVHAVYAWHQSRVSTDFRLFRPQEVRFLPQIVRSLECTTG